MVGRGVEGNGRAKEDSRRGLCKKAVFGTSFGHWRVCWASISTISADQVRLKRVSVAREGDAPLSNQTQMDTVTNAFVHFV